jgi:hypothetical protein
VLSFELFSANSKLSAQTQNCDSEGYDGVRDFWYHAVAGLLCFVVMSCDDALPDRQ